MATQVDAINTASSPPLATAAAAAAAVAEPTIVAPAAVASTAKQASGDTAASSVRAVTSATSNHNGTKNNDKVCRFLISKLQGGKGYANNDFRIDFLQSKHGLYDIAETAFRLAQKEKLTNDQIYSHLWQLSFNGKVYRNGWRRPKYPDSDEWSRPANESDIDAGEPRLFSSLETPLKESQKGKFGGESASFEFVLESIMDATSAGPLKVKYPHVRKVESQISTKVEDDWLTPSQKMDCDQLRDKWVNFYNGNNGWKRVKRCADRSFTRAKPTQSMWSSEELQIMGLLINADCKFKKCWTNIMEYAFLDRTEGGCSMRWYQLKKEDYRLVHIGKKLSNTGRISLAKRLAKSMMSVKLEQKPKREPHPYENADESFFREFAARDMAYED
eukprot:scaffold127_cov37-Cyclotella_meneghiniana.AAC.1